MNKTIKILILLFSLIGLISCGESSSEERKRLIKERQEKILEINLKNYIRSIGHPCEKIVYVNQYTKKHHYQVMCWMPEEHDSYSIEYSLDKRKLPFNSKTMNELDF